MGAQRQRVRFLNKPAQRFCAPRISRRWFFILMLALGLPAVAQPLQVYQGVPPGSGGGAGGGTGTVTSVGASVPSWLSVSGVPITDAGTIAISTASGQTSHRVIGTCGTATSFGVCALVADDLPALSALNGAVTDSQVPNSISIDTAGTAGALSANGANCSAGQFPLGVDAAGAAESCSTSLSGNASTATALVVNGANCSAGAFPLGVDASGAAESCSTAISGNAATATALAANGANCSAGSYPLGVDASGAVESCTAVSAGGIGGSTGSVDEAILRSDGTGGSTAQASSVTLHDTNGTFVQTTTNGGFNFTTNGTGRVLFGVNGGLSFNANGDWSFLNAAGTAFSRLRVGDGFALSAGISDALRLQSSNGATNWSRIDSSGMTLRSTGKYGIAEGSDIDAGMNVSQERIADGVWKDTNWRQWAGECYVASDQTNATTTPASSTCSISVTSGRNYAFKCVLMQSDSVAAEGASIDFAGGTAGETYFRAQVTAFDSALNLSTQVDDLTDVASAGTFTGSGTFEVHGAFQPSSSGTFIPRFAQASHVTGTLTLFRGSHCLMWDAP